MPWGLSPAHLLVILVILLIVVGPGKLPETGAAIGKAVRAFKDALEGGGSTNAAEQPQITPPTQPQIPAYPAAQGMPAAPPMQPVAPDQAAEPKD
jgi:sec-independent protein translocase protein TatA